MKTTSETNSFLKALRQKYVQQEVPVLNDETEAPLQREATVSYKASTVPPEKQYLIPLHTLYTYCVKTGLLQAEEKDIDAFEDYFLGSVKAMANYSAVRVAITSFSKMLSAEAAHILEAWKVPAKLAAMEAEAAALEAQALAAAEAEKAPLTEGGAQAPNTQGELCAAWEGDLEPDGVQEQMAEEAVIEEAVIEEAVIEVAVIEEAVIEEAVIEEPPLFKHYTTSNKMNAFVCVFPSNVPKTPMTREMVDRYLEEESIVFGIDEVCVYDLLEQQLFFQILPIAQGNVPLHGKDGQVIVLIDCSKKIEVTQDEHGVSDFRNLNFVHSVVKDQTICGIILPTQGTPGTNISGEITPPRDGKPAPNICGKNTLISEDGTRLLAEIDGRLTERGGIYSVEPVLVIEGNVDYGTGNLAFTGDIIVKGDVANGFRVKAEGNITIHGIVEGAEIISGGDIVLSKGIKGNSTGGIDAKGTVRTTFLENCTIYTGADLYADSIITCKVFCGGTVYVLSNRGTIVGGSITAYSGVEAKLIGCPSRRETDIILGDSPRMSEKRMMAVEEMTTVLGTLQTLNKNLEFLKKMEDQLPADKLDILKQLELQSVVYEHRKDELQEIIASIPDTLEKLKTCSVKCNNILPPTKISIGQEFIIVKDTRTHCRIFLSDEGVVVGSL